MHHTYPKVVTTISAIVGVLAAIMLCCRWSAHSSELAKERLSCAAPQLQDFGFVLRFVTVGALSPGSPLDEAAIKKAERGFLAAYAATHPYTLLVKNKGPMSLCDEVGLPCIQGEWLIFIEPLK